MRYNNKYGNVALWHCGKYKYGGFCMPVVMDHLNKKSLKSQVKDYLRDQIGKQRIKPGQKLPTERELAETLDVSKRTVELAMRELELEKIIFRRVGKGSFLIDSTKVKNSVSKDVNLVMIVVPSLMNPAFSAFIEVIERKLSIHGKRVVIALVSTLESRKDFYLKMVERDGVDGIIGFMVPKYLYDYARSNDIPMVLAGPKNAQPQCNIANDLEKAGLLAAKHLYELGHRQIVCTGCFPLRGDEDLDLRFKTIVDFFEKRRGSVEIIPQQEKASSSLDYERIGHYLVERTLDLKQRPTAIVFYNDARAFGGLKALREKGFSVPDDFAVVGFDNVYMGRLSDPSLTTVDFGYEKAAEMAVEMLVGRKKKNIMMEPELVVRESTQRHGI